MKKEPNIILPMLNQINGLQLENKLLKEVLGRAKFVLSNEIYKNDQAVKDLLQQMTRSGVKAFPGINFDV